MTNLTVVAFTVLATLAVVSTVGLFLIGYGFRVVAPSRERHQHLVWFHTTQEYANTTIVMGTCKTCGKDVEVRLSPIYGSGKRVSEVVVQTLILKGWMPESGHTKPDGETAAYMKEPARV